MEIVHEQRDLERYMREAVKVSHDSPVLLDRLHEVTGVDVPRGTLATEAAMWEATIDAAAAEDEEMAAYIAQLEAKRDTWDSPDASGEAIAQAFERFFRRNGEGPGDHKR